MKEVAVIHLSVTEWRHFFAVFIGVSLVLGCDSAPLRHEVARLEKQLTDADARLTAATAQLEIANDLTRATHAENEKVGTQVRQLQAALERAQDDAATNERRWKQERDRLAAEVTQSKTEAERLAREIANAKEVQQPAFDAKTLVGVWEFGDHDRNRFRLAFYEDGTIKAQMEEHLVTGKTRWRDPRRYPYAFDQLKLFGDDYDEITCTREADGTVSLIVDYFLGQKGVEVARLRQTDANEGAIQICVCENHAAKAHGFRTPPYFMDSFGKPKWVAVQRVNVPDAPGYDSVEAELAK
jgi:hypothetical protein